MKKFKSVIEKLDTKIIKRIPKTIRLLFLALLFLFVLLGIVKLFSSYASLEDDYSGSTYNDNSGVSGNTVTVDDFKRDYDYYMGLNYTYSSNSTTPTTENKNIYSDSNLVKVYTTYKGTDINNNYTGYVSQTELQSDFVYNKIYSVNNNGTASNTSDDYVEFLLIDNPYANRPTNKGFNGWLTNYEGAQITYNSDYYERYVKIPITYSSGVPNEIHITFNAMWIDAAIGDTSSSWADAFSSIYARGMRQIATQRPIYEDISDLYVSGSVEFYDYYPDGALNNRGASVSGRCWSNTCTYYTLVGDDPYNSSNEYYELVNNRMRAYTVQITGYEPNPDAAIGQSAAGFYKAVSLRRNKSIAGYYNSTGVYQSSGTCTSNTCTYYEYIQYYDSSNNQNVFENGTNYYYLVTRDTNIIVMNESISAPWGTSYTKPFTLTSLHNGTSYKNSATLTIGSNNGYGSSYYLKCSGDTRLEYLSVYSRISAASSNATNSNTANGYIYANMNNLKIGRGVTSSNSSYKVSAGVVGGPNGTGSSWSNPTDAGSSSNLQKYKIIVESGTYNTLNTVNTGGNSQRVYVDAKAIYGSDYDRVTKDNDNLDVYYNVVTSSGGYLYSNDYKNFLTSTIFKSGTFGSSESGYTTGIYATGTYGHMNYASTETFIEGGKTYNFIIGPGPTDDLEDINSGYMYMTGGEVNMVFGGAGRVTCYGNRILQITGGTVNYSVFGGSNGYEDTGSDEDSYPADVAGDSYVYIGGTAVIGGENEVTNNSSLYYASAGNVFGIGNGREGYNKIGTVDNSNIVINGGTIKKDIYGGGNFSATGVNSSSSTTNTNIKIINGTISGNVFGGGNQNGSGSNTIKSTINIDMTGGKVNTSVYGGSNISGTINGDVDIDIVSGTITQSVFGGGKGGYSSSTNPGTFVSGAVDVTIGDTNITPGPTISGEVFGGSAFGTVNGKTNTTTVSQNPTNVTVNKGTINSVFGGGKGDSTYTPYVEGNIKVTINDGTITNVFGGNDAAGVPNGKVEVILNGGTITNTYGGGNKTSVPETNVTLQGATCTNIFGGSNQQGDVNKSNVTATSGTASSIYGGNNEGGTTNDANVEIDGATVSEVYGGGNVATTTKTNVNLKSGTVTDTYGGGKSASITETTLINQNGATCTTIFGGSNSSGTVPTSTININAGTTTSVYGGNNAGGTTEVTNINLESGKATNVFGGGNKASSTTSNIKLDGTNTRNIYGGGNEAGLTTSNISLRSGTATNVFGGSNSSGTVKTSNIQTEETTKTNLNNETEIKLNITQTVVAVDPYWQDTNYSSVVTLNVSVTNNSDKTITKWSGMIKDEDSKLYSNYSNHEIAEDNGVYTFNQINKYDENAPIELAPGQTHTFQFQIYSKKSPSEFSIDEKSIVGVSASGDSYVQNSSNLIVSNLYGGNNEGGLTETTNIDLTKGYIHNVYGGGNLAPVDNANINCNGVSIGGQLYGGGNRAAVNNDTKVDFINSSIIGSIYGGGNAGVVKGNTKVYISSSTIGENVYAGGNGAAAIVEGNTLATIDGTTNIGQSVFGGGNAAQTGTEEKNNSISTVNIAGATIGGNVYGGANTSKVYGNTKLNIGYNTIPNNTELVKGDISIKGTIFGGGEANASGSDNYDFSFISVTKGIDILIDGASHNDLTIEGSIFGSGNASSTSGYSNITISNYGSVNNIKRNISLQRADKVIINNSHIELNGAKDRTNDYANELFSISRIDELKIKNNTTLYLHTGANLLKKYVSAVDVQDSEQIAAVTINDDTQTVTKNVDNRIYMYEGKALNIATNQNITEYGPVSGMTFFGMYQRSREGEITTALYDRDYNYGSSISSNDLYAFSKGSYVLGKHLKSHNIKVDGFYSNFDPKDNSGKVKVAYIEPTPDDADYYMWSIGEQVKEYPLSLTASKYLTLGTTDLSFIMHSTPNSTFSVVGFSFADLNEDVNLVDEASVPRVASTTDQADKTMSLVMKTPSTGWMNKGQTQFLSNSEHPIDGTIDYRRENTVGTPVLQFYLYHSKNLGTSGSMGEVVVSLVVITPISDLQNEVERVNIVITLNRALFNTNDYEATAAPGKQYSLFASDKINITTTGSFSNYYSLYTEQENFYKAGYHRTLVSDYVLPAKTKITLIDFHDHNDPNYYYYIVSDSDYQNALQEFQTNREVTYNFSNFIRMGSTSPGNKYDDAVYNQEYYDSSTHVSQEEFIAIVDFSESNIQENVIEKRLLIELKDSDNQTRVSVLGIQQDGMKYNLIHGQDPVIDVQGQLSSTNIYPGDEVRLNVTTDFISQVYEGSPIYDTVALDNQLGIKITIFDQNNHQVTGASLLGISYELDGVKHYPRVDGSTRINIAEKVSNVLARIKINTTSSLAPGQYTMRIESFSSPDGIYYGLVSSDYVDIPFNVLNNVYGLEVTLPEKQVIINKETGKNLNGNNTEVFNYKYSSVLSNPEIHISLKRRNYNTVFSTQYDLVDIKDYFTNEFTSTSIEKEYLLTKNPSDNTNLFLTTKPNLVSGTYKVVFSLYDGTNYIGEVYQYLIIK